MIDVRAIAARPHPIGSPEIEETRSYLMTRMSALGLDPQIRDQTAIVTRRYSGDFAIGGRVRNIVGELKGTDPALPAVIVMAHYDTAPLSPGAGDDTSGIAVALEVARGLNAGAPLRRSVIFLFTDGEEVGLLGATAFFESDPLRRRAGLVINLEARGDSGKTLMFQTSPDNRALVEIYRRHARTPAADSLMVTIYKRMPNDTDLTAALDKGHPGMNFAFAGHQMAYHSPLSTAESLNPASLQHMGDQVLPVVRAFARADTIDAQKEDMIFADLFGQYLIAYPPWAGWLLTITAALAAFTLTGIGLARGRIGWRDTLAGAGGLLTLLLGIAAVLMVALRLLSFLLRGVTSPYALIGQFAWTLPATILLGAGSGGLLLYAAANGRRWPAAVLLAATGIVAALSGSFSLTPLLLGIAAAVAAAASLARHVSLNGWFAGAVTLLGLLAIALQIMLPSGAHVLAWPLLLLLPSLALLLFSSTGASRPIEQLVMALPAALLAGLMARSTYDFFVLIGTTLPAVTAPFIVVALLALVPLVWPLRSLRLVGGICVAGGMAICAAVGINGQSPSARSPEMVEAFHLAKIDEGRASWVSGKLDRTGWVAAVLAQDGGTPRLQSIAPLAKDDHWVARARPAAFIKPQLSLSVTGEGRSRTIDLGAANTNGGRYMRIFVKPSVDLSGVRIMGRPVPGTLKAGVWSQFIYHASGVGAVRLSIAAPKASGSIEAKLLEVRDGWPRGSKPPPLPPHVMGFRRAGNSMIVTNASLKW